MAVKSQPVNYSTNSYWLVDSQSAMKSGEQTQNTYAIYPLQTKQILRAVAGYIHSILVLLLLLFPDKKNKEQPIGSAAAAAMMALERDGSVCFP